MSKPRAFTLIELLVAIAITAIIIVFASQVLSHVSEAAGHGASTSEIIQSSRMISEQLDDDFAQMIGPGGDGFLIILQKRLDSVHMTQDDYDRDESEGNFSGTLQYASNVRADQIVFVRNRGTLEPLGPRSRSDYASPSSALYVKVSYGHVERTAEDGSTTTNAVSTGTGTGGLSSNSEGLGIRDPNSPFAPRRNYFAADWIFGRQALFLDPSVGSGGLEAHAIDEPNVPRSAGAWNAFLHPSAGSYANSPSLNNVINGLSAPRVLEKRVYMALTDRADIDYGDIVNDFQRGYIDNAGTAGPAAGRSLLDYAYAWERLRVNPTPQPDFDAWRIAQMHPYFVANVSDIQIDFAGDYDGTDGIDTLATAIDVDNDSFDDFPVGTLKWYSSIPNEPKTTFYDSSQPATWPLPATVFGSLDPSDGSVVTAPPDPTQAVRDPNDPDPISRPVRRSATDPSPVAPYNTNADAAYIFRPQGDDWPYLIRIRYRIHDSQAKTMDANGNLGRVFEQILKIPR